MSRGISAKAPSKAQMVKQERHYQAESLVRDKVMNSPEVKKAIAACEKQLAQVQRSMPPIKIGKGKK